jgi:hypothetical protein
MAAADAQTAARVERMGMSLISPAAGLAALEGVLGQLGGLGTVAAGQVAAAGSRSVVAAAPFAWGRFLQRFGGDVPQLFAELAEEAAATARPAAGERGSSTHFVYIIDFCLWCLPVCCAEAAVIIPHVLTC